MKDVKKRFKEARDKRYREIAATSSQVRQYHQQRITRVIHRISKTFKKFLPDCVFAIIVIQRDTNTQVIAGSSTESGAIKAMLQDALHGISKSKESAAFNIDPDDPIIEEPEIGKPH